MSRIKSPALAALLLTLLASAGTAQTQRQPARAKPPAAAGTPAAAATAEPEKDPFAERAAVRVGPVSRRVLALYYPWYGTPQKSGKWLHLEGVDAAAKQIASHAHFPALGAYDSADPAVIDKHLEQAKSAGIDTLVCSWWGRQDPTDKAFRALLAAAPAKKMTVCVLWERLGGSKDASAAELDLAYLLESFGKQPGYLQEGGKPVVFMLSPLCHALPPEQWADVLARVSARNAPGVRIIGEGGTQADALLWDGLHTLAYLSRMAERSPTICARIQADTFRVPILLSRATDRISVLTLSPGCDERKQAKRAGQSGGLVLEREDGRLYLALWEQAMQDNPDWVLVNSFNQWHSGTEIEPSVELGDQYLTLTREAAARFKKLPVRGK